MSKRSDPKQKLLISVQWVAFFGLQVGGQHPVLLCRVSPVSATCAASVSSASFVSECESERGRTRQQEGIQANNAEQCPN